MDNKFHTNLIVSSSPHIVTESDTTRLMGSVLLALAPAWIASIYIFGLRALLLSVVCVAASVLFEYLFNAIVHKKQTVGDLSAALTGLLIAFNGPASFPFWQAIIGCLFAIVVVKGLFGGIGKNFSNPAITARIFLFISFSANMSTWPVTRLAGATDATTGATALEQLASNGAMQWSALDAFLGFIPGSFGETSTLAILIGAAILLFTGIASWKTMVSVFAGGAAMAYFFSALGCFDYPAYYHLIVGGFAFGAVFMATDPVTSAQTNCGKWIYGFMVGALAVLIRVINPAYPEGMMLSILFMNALAPLIDYYVVNANINRRLKRATK